VSAPSDESASAVFVANTEIIVVVVTLVDSGTLAVRLTIEMYQEI
jgi:hypothetical protein